MSGRPRVLLAEDHPGVVRALQRVLSLQCDVVGLVDDGREVAPAAARLEPVVSVVDLHLPNVSGLEACRRITRTNHRAKVILITALIDDGIRMAALAAGASGCFSKLMAGTELIDAIGGAWLELAEGGE